MLFFKPLTSQEKEFPVITTSTYVAFSPPTAWCTGPFDIQLEAYVFHFLTSWSHQFFFSTLIYFTEKSVSHTFHVSPLGAEGTKAALF